MEWSSHKHRKWTFIIRMNTWIQTRRRAHTHTHTPSVLLQFVPPVLPIFLYPSLSFPPFFSPCSFLFSVNTNIRHGGTAVWWRSHRLRQKISVHPREGMKGKNIPPTWLGAQTEGTVCSCTDGVNKRVNNQTLSLCPQNKYKHILIHLILTRCSWSLCEPQIITEKLQSAVNHL